MRTKPIKIHYPHRHKGYGYCGVLSDLNTDDWALVTCKSCERIYQGRKQREEEIKRRSV